MAIDIQVWRGSGSATITDMENAGKRGKTCRTFRFSGLAGGMAWSGQPYIRAAEFTAQVLAMLEPGKPIYGQNFDTAVAMVEAVVDQARAEGIGDGLIGGTLDEIRGVDAPVPELTAGNGKWSGKADRDGVFLRDLTDQNNDPAMCTFKQSHSQAYRLAAKVWDRLATCETMHEASDVLSKAGVKLHYWCMID